MKALLLLAIATIAGLVVMAVVFRSETARDMLRLGRVLVYAWIALVLTLGILTLLGRGL